jgi:hypothetical protein
LPQKKKATSLRHQGSFIVAEDSAMAVFKGKPD